MSVAAERRAWSGRRWGITAVLVLGAQLGLLWWLEDRTPPHRISSAPAPSLSFAGLRQNQPPAPDHPTLTDLADPTLFALPHPQGFSASLWRWTNSGPLQTFLWSAPYEWLAPTSGFQEMPPAITNAPTLSLSARLEPVPDFTLPTMPPLPVLRDRSVWHIEGELAQRRLLTPLSPQTWTTNTVLTNSVVRLLVDAEGRTLSATLLNSCKYEPADTQALEQARAARFDTLAQSGPARVTSPLAHLTWGQIVIEWATLPSRAPESEESSE